MALYDALWDALFLLLLLGFVAGNIFLALAVRSGGRLARWVGAAYWAAAGLTVLILMSEVGGVGGASLGGAADWLDPIIQPAGRALIGLWLWLWLWRAAADESPLRSHAAAERGALSDKMA